MVKILSPSSSKMYRNSEQYSDCSDLLKADDPPLEELDPAILSCGLPAIILSEVQPVFTPPIRYTIGQLQTIRKSSLCHRRPIVADDPRVSAFAIWRTQPIQPNRRGGSNKPPVVVASPQQKDQLDQKAAGGNNASKEKSPEQAGKAKNQHNGRENGFVGPRFRRNYEFSNSNHHAIVKSYRSDGDHHHHHHLQNTVIEEEPEWVSAGPTSRLDTIELRGFDDDLSVSQSSSEKANSGDGKNSSKNSGKHISFYDDLHHYEHVHAKKTTGGHLKPHDSSGRENDVESVTTSNTSSPPPARSTPTKHMTEFNNMMEDAQKHTSGVNVHNFEEFMKFDSLLGSDSVPGNGGQSGSRFSKWFRRGGNSFNPSVGQNYDGRRHAFHPDNIAHGGNNRYPMDRNYPQQQYPSRFSSYTNQGPGNYHSPSADSNSAFKRLVDMMAQNRVNNNLVAQQQYLLQMLNKNQQSEILRRMLIKNTVDNASDANNQQPPAQPPRVPTQLELQLHTQSIMQNALLRKKLQDQRKVLFEQNTQIAEMAAAAGKAEPNAEVQQFVKSVSPNIQRSLSLLSQTTGNGAGGGGGHYRSFNQTFPGGNTGMNNAAFTGGSHHPDLSASLRQMLLPPQHQQQQGPRSFGNRRRFEKRSVSWKHPN